MNSLFPELADLQAFFANPENIPTEPITLAKGETIRDCELFLQCAFERINSNINSGRIYWPAKNAYENLIKLRKILTNEYQK